jgi:hypothetical protein
MNKGMNITVISLVSLLVLVIFIRIFSGIARHQHVKKGAPKKPVLVQGQKVPAVSPVPAPVVKKREPGVYELEGIIYSENPIAIINGKILTKDGKIDDLVVIDITPQKVELLNQKTNTSITLNL